MHLKELFEKLDKNSDGFICIDELMEAMNKNQFTNLPACFAKQFIIDADENGDGLIDFNEFVKYVEQKEKRLKLAFSKFDIDGNKSIDIKKIQKVFREFNISINEEEAKNLLNKIDKSGDLLISWEEWKDFLFFHPVKDIPQILYFWQHGNFIDAGTDWVLPDDIEISTTDTMPLLLRRLICGGIAGGISRTCTAPLDRVKVLLQVHGYKHVDSGIIKSIKYMVQEGGILSMWRGNGINVIKIAPETALRYSMYEYFKSWLHSTFGWEDISSGGQIALSHKFMAASMAGVTAQTLIYPLETLKTRLCLRKTGQFSSLQACATSIYKERGIFSFYRGFTINIMGIIPYAGIEMTLYEKCKTTYLIYQGDEACQTAMNPLVIPLMSTFSCVIGMLATYPMSLVRTKLQSKSQFDVPQINSVLGLVKEIWKTGGIRGMYRGISANLCKVLPASSISYLTYETLNHKFRLQSFGSNV